jgi:hypothetical protein
MLSEGSTVGYKRLLRFAPVTTSKVRLTIDKYRLPPVIAEFGLFRQLPAVAANPSSASFPKQVKVALSSPDNDVQIFYTTDGSEPGKNSQLYNKPLTISESTILMAIAIRNDGTEGFPIKAEYLKALSGISLVNGPDEKYRAGGALALVDGATGSLDFADGHWCGFNGCDFEALLDLGGIKTISDFSIQFNETTASWIFGPRYVEFGVSENGKDFQTIASQNFMLPPKDSQQIIPFKFTYECRARFVKVKATNAGKLPDWHPGKGEPAWLFVDEITVK